MPRPVMTAEEILGALSETPNRLATLTGIATPAQLRAIPAPLEWSVTEVLAHLRSCAYVWGDAIATIVDKDRPTLKAISPTTWIESTNYRELEFSSSLKAFTRQRSKLLTLLEGLPPESWSRLAIVIGAGSPLERTAHDYASWLARHERTHWRQVKKTVAAVVGE